MKKLIFLCISSFALLNGCGTPSSATTSSMPNTTASTNVSAANTVSAANDSSSENVSQNTVSNTTVTTDDSNTTSTNSSPTPVTSELQALQIVTDLYMAQKKSDPKLTIDLDHLSSSQGKTVFVIHVYDDMTDHTATIAWIGVRSDGYIQDNSLPHGWVLPEDFFREYPMDK